jgi:NAD-dependent dihydropyrimidine dehydrogenase PreA subunit
MSNQKERTTGDLIKEAEQKQCPVRKAGEYIDAFLKELMCGKCFPCALGTFESASILRDIIVGRGTQADLHALTEIAEILTVASRCKKGKDTGQFILDLLRTGAFSEHIGGRCSEHECSLLSEYRIVPERCVMCGECQVVCKVHAVVGEKKIPYLGGHVPFEIVSKRCIRCGECVRVCPNDAIIVVDKKDIIEVGVS